MKRPRDVASASHLHMLADRIRGLDAEISCGGTIELPSPVTLSLRSGQTIPLVEDRGYRRTDVGKRLAKLCAPAVFGVGQETRRDPRVRDGGQLLAARGAFDVLGLDLEASGILGEVRRVLCGGQGGLPDAALYALNVYPRGGHFVGHKDTPRDRDTFGTLVVCLPIPFGGGRLVLRHETTRAYDWESPSYLGRPATTSYRIHWAAFYGDVDHEIERVTDGTRVTLTWLLRSRGGGDPGRRPAAATTEADLEDALGTALRDPGFSPKTRTLGVPCLHLYAETPGLVRPADALSTATVSRLKGRDRLVAAAAQRAGLAVRYRPYLFETGADESWRLARPPSKTERAIFRDDRLGATELEDTMPIERHSEWTDDDDVTWLVPPPWRRERRDEPTGPRGAVPETELLGDLEYSATDYFGNEACDSAFYVAGALLIDVPARRGRRSG